MAEEVDFCGKSRGLAGKEGFSENARCPVFLHYPILPRPFCTTHQSTLNFSPTQQSSYLSTDRLHIRPVRSHLHVKGGLVECVVPYRRWMVLKWSFCILKVCLFRRWVGYNFEKQTFHTTSSASLSVGIR